MGRQGFAIFVIVVLVSTCASQEQYDVRLSGNTTNLREGYVEVFYNGTWGTVCRKGWDFLDAFVVCRQLGFSWVSYRGWEEDFGPGSGPAWLSNVACRGSERSLANCSNDGWMKHKCTSPSAAAISCGFIEGYSKAKAYLGDGLPYSTYAMSEGNAYLKFSAERYYALTDYGWYDLQSYIFCHQRNQSVGGGFAAFASKQRSYFGRHGAKLKPVDGKELPVSVLPVKFSCQGGEKVITDCPAEALPNGTALLGHDAGVICAIRQPRPDFNVRLVDGDSECLRTTQTHPCQGLVEVIHNRSWGSIQYKLGSKIPGYDTNLADVVCRQLGHGYPTVVSRDGRFGKSSTDVKMIINACSGAESSLAECGPDLQFVDKVGEGYNLSIVCSGPVEKGSIPLRLYSNQHEIPSWPDGDYKKVNGTLQVFYGDRFGTVCNKGWDYENTDAVCILLGYGTGQSALSGVQHRVGGPMYLQNVSCIGDEWSFSQCSRGEWLNTTCDHGENVEIVCYGRLDDFGPPLFVYYKNTRGFVCKDGFDHKDGVVFCRQYRYPFAVTWSLSPRQQGVPVWLSNVQCTGHEKALADCPNDGWKDHTSCGTIAVDVWCKDEDGYMEAKAFIEDGLGDSAVTSEGTAMLRLKTGEVVGICDKEWNLDDAKAFCHQIGKYSAEAATTDSHFGQHYGWSPPSDGRRTLDVRYWCSGGEASLKQCPAGNYCGSIRNAGVRCLYREEPEMFKIRLVSKKLAREGRVEVFYDGSWGSVGNDVNMMDPIRYGDVICRQLDLGYAVNVSVNSGEFGISTLPVKMTGVWCAGSESSLAQCGPNLKWVGTANHTLKGDNSGIVCSGKIPDSAHPLRLSPESPHERQGYLEIFQDYRFAKICNDDWYPENTEVACRELGFGPPELTSGVHRRGQGVHGGPIFWSNYHCSGNESRLEDCPTDEPFPHYYCSHDLDVYIICAQIECTEAKPCLNGGICNNSKCDCKEGFSGERCQHASTGVINHAGLATLLASILVAMLGTVMAS